MTNIEFSPEPPLWPEEWTDCFRLNLDHNNEEATEAIESALECADIIEVADYIWHVEERTVFTSHQLFAGQLVELLYAFEIAYTHAHSPRNHG